VAVRTATGVTAGALMTDIVLVATIVVLFFVIGFAVGVLIVGGTGRWWNGRQHRDSGRKPDL
jgi:hypothetical protein